MKKTKKKKRPIKASPPKKTEQRFRLPPQTIRLTENEEGVHVPTQIQLFRTGTFKKLMPDGKSITFSITKEILEEMIENWKNKVRGTDIALDFAHKSDEEAAGWFTNLYLEESGNEIQLWGEVEWTPDGYAAVGGKKFRYFSPDFAFAWTDNETGRKYGATLFGAGLTNRPVIKNMAPTVELTEVHEMDLKQEFEALKLKLGEVEAEKKALELKLEEEKADDDEEDEDDAPKAKDKKKEKEPEMNMEELKTAYQKVCDEMAEMRKSMAKSLAETQAREQEAKFAVLLAEGKVVPAQKEAFLSNDTIKFAELSQVVKFDALGDQGGKVNADKESAEDEILKLAEEKAKEKKISRGDAISLVLHENPKLNARYVAEKQEQVA